MSLNSQYIVLFKNPRDRQQIAILARQMSPGNASKLLKAYEKAVSVANKITNKKVHAGIYAMN